MKKPRDLNDYRDLLSRITIPHPAFELAGVELERAYDSVGRTSFPQCFQLLGPSRAGKTCVIKRFVAKYPPVREPERLHVRVVYAPIPPKGTPAGVMENLLKALGDPMWARGSQTNKLSRLLTLLEKCGCRMIVFDEFQHLIDKGQNQTLKQTRDWLKALVEPNQWALVASGLSDSRSAIDQDEQLRGRFDPFVAIRRFDWGDAELHEQFRGVLSAFQQAMTPFDLPSLEGDEMALRMYLATGGLIGLLVKLLHRAVEDAIRAKRVTISKAQLELAFRRAIRFASDIPSGKGPFEVPLVGVAVEPHLEQVVRLATTCDAPPDPPPSNTKPASGRRKTNMQHKRDLAEAI